MNVLNTPSDCCLPDSCNPVVVNIPGPKGDKGDPGTPCTPCTNGANAWTLLTSTFTQPASSANAVTNVADNSWIVVGQIVFLQFIGFLQVFAKSGANQVTLTNLGFPSSAAPGTVAAIGAFMSPGGERGAVGSTGAGGATGSQGIPGNTGPSGATGAAGGNAYTALTSNFTMPAISASGTAVVGNSDWATIGQVVFLQGAGTLQVTAKPSSTQVTLLNPAAYTANVAVGTVINSPATISPSGLIGPAAPLQFQVASSATAQAFGGGWAWDDSIPQIGLGTEVITVSITPINASSKLVIEALAPVSPTNAGAQKIIAAIFQDAIANALAATAVSFATNNFPGQIAIQHEVVSGSTAARTYRLRLGTSDGNPMGVNGDDAGNRKFGGVQKIWLKVTEFPP